MKTMPATQVAGIFIMGFVRGDSRDQGALFPVSLDQLVPADHVCRVIDAVVVSLDLVQLGFSKAQPAPTGSRAPLRQPAIPDLRKAAAHVARGAGTELSKTSREGYSGLGFTAIRPRLTDSSQM